MAVTSQASSVTNFPLRTFNTGPGYFQETPAREQQTAKKSATERLTESRANFVRRGSRDELEDNQGEESRSDANRPHQIHASPTQDDTQVHVYRVGPFVYGNDGNKGQHASKKSCPRPPPAVPEKPPHLTGVRKGSRDRTLEIVEASLTAYSGRQNVSSDDDVVFTPSQGIIVGNYSNSNSPQSAREGSSSGSRVRKLKEQFQNMGSPESESDTSQGGVTPTDLQKTGSSSSSPHELKMSNLISHQKDPHMPDFQDQTGSDATKRNKLQPQSSHTLSGKSKLPEKCQVEADNLTKSWGASSEEDPSQTSEHGMKSETRQALSSSSDVLAEQTRRQMERFKARYATGITKENNQERKISKIVLKPQNQATERKERSSFVNEPSHKTSSSLVKPRSHTSKDESTDQLVGTGKNLFVRPQASFQFVTERDKKFTENAKQDCTAQKTFLANHNEGGRKAMDQDVSKTVTSEDVRRLRRAKEHNVSGQSTERWGDAEETNKTQRSVPGHAVHHAGDRVLVQVSGRVFPTKHHVGDKAFQIKPQPEDTIQQDSPLEVIHRRVKSDLDQSCAARSLMKTEANSRRVRHRSQDDQLQQGPLVPESVQEVSAPNVFLAHARSSPDSITDFQKKSWAPINFNQNQERNDRSKRNTGQGSHCHGSRVLSSDILKAETNNADLQTPPSHAHHNTQRKIFSPENTHAHAKSTLQSFLCGMMSSPEGGKIPFSLTNQKDTDTTSRNLHPPHVRNDNNGNCIASECSAPEMPSRLIHGGATRIEVSRTHREAVNDDINSNVYFAIENQNKPADVSLRVVASKDVELTAVRNQKDANESKKVVIKEIQANAGPGGRYIKHCDKGKILRVEHSELTTVESDKRRKFSQNSDTSSSKQDGVHHGRNEAATSKVEEPRVRKMNLSELLSKDATVGRANPSVNTDQLKRAEVNMFSCDATNSKWPPPPKSDRSHNDDSETDSDLELQRSKVLRLKKTQRRAENKKEDKSLQKLLSRIINPEDDLNTLKRGQKLKAPKTTRKSSRTTLSSSTGESENEVRVDKVIATRQKSTSKRKDNEKTAPNVRKPLLILNRKQSSNNSRAVKREDPISPPESLTSPTRRDFLRRRSKSDLGMSPRCSVSSAHSDVEHFFNQMGLNESFHQKPLSPAFQFSDEDEVFHEMHEYKHTRDDDGGSFSTENSDNISQGSKVSEEGLHLAKKLPDTSQSIITKNARVIKWLCQMRKARSSSFS